VKPEAKTLLKGIVIRPYRLPVICIPIPTGY
jgi:hypothetical protein